MAKNKNKKRHILFRMPLSVWIVLIAAFAFIGNFAVQVARKPTEILGLLETSFHKHPEQTWNSYSDVFVEKSTPIVTYDLLAALAQLESNGNPLIRTYWKWRWTDQWDRIFAPASSAVGMFQITEGTFEEAKKFCIQEGRVIRHGENGEFCSGLAFRSRLIPSHAIEMTSARLHYHTDRLSRSRKRTSHRDRQTLAVVIHLCGLGKAEKLVRAAFDLKRIGRCGDHDPASYVGRVRRMQDKFHKLAALSRGEG